MLDQSLDLSRARLTNAYLTGADLSGAELINAKLNGTNLTTADLTRAVLIKADLNKADLNNADLAEAQLAYANLTSTIVSGTNLTNSFAVDTSFVGVSLWGIKGLSLVKHGGPSYISIDTLEKTAADLGKDASKQHDVEMFLENAGVPKEYIEFFRSRVGQPIQFYSCFISYSTKDQPFADRIYADLRRKGIRCWLATEDLKIDDKFRTRINEAIRLHDKLLVVLSQESVKSSWVEDEVEAAFEREQRDGTIVLFPIRLDDAVMDCDAAWAAKIRRTRHIGNFRKWKDHDEYTRSLERLVRDLRPESGDSRKTAGGKND
jgi:hypothetical protein